eukprot:CAMPEP_0201475784 /NCGR_PEP_ID=MMETSP0151_2-20130828/1153_1 /ASSEMBLY_ACC=CAM_ASM_000257 /TAXON_ID=200890 /ORGANISM="Paramoeba atlantica, Strain 621/1 / CCAP 1560/9" /LENGTH=77 /DNA_ID=CAMNT_0047855977 /DNA_START=124 /DNA_END=357 /DNA_ORIENTATION=-
MSGAGQLTVEEIQEAFYNFDENRSFTLSMEELRRIVGEEGEPIPDVQDFLAEAQQFADGRGNVDYRAFADMMLLGGK